MRRIEKYTGDKTYMFPNGAIATPDAMLASFPAVLAFAHIIETDEMGEVCFAVQNLSAMRGFYGIPPELTEGEAIAAIEEAVNAPEVPVQGESTDMRMAQALEAIAAGQTAEGEQIMEILLGEDE